MDNYDSKHVVESHKIFHSASDTDTRAETRRLRVALKSGKVMLFFFTVDRKLRDVKLTLVILRDWTASNNLDRKV